MLYSSVEGQMPSLANVGRDAVQPAPSPGAMSAQEFQGTMSIQPGGSSDISGRPTGAYTGEPEVAPDGGAVEPTAPVSEIDRLQQEVDDLDTQIGFINSRSGDASNLENQRDRKLAQLETEQARLEAQERDAEQAAATQRRMEPLINQALNFLLDDQGNVRARTSQIANVSGFAAGALPGVTSADARLARAAVTELAAIAAMGSVREAREAGFGGSLSDADILLIQRSGGTFDLSQPEATAMTLRRLQNEMGLSSNRYSDEDIAIIEKYR
jgi:hypothetical protein